MARTKKKNTEVKKVPLVPGMVFTKNDNVYTKQMIISDKVNDLSSGLYRECVAWNEEKCRRYDTTEDELYKSERIGVMEAESLAEYVHKNKKDEWDNPSIPKYTEG